MTPLRGLMTLPADAWQARAAAHAQRLHTLLGDYPAWRDAKRPHPVFDFLFTYYAFSLGRLGRWTPGYGHRLEGRAAARLYRGRPGFAVDADSAWLSPDAFTPKRRHALRWMLDLLRATAARPGFFGCFGLHEWAMVYRSRQVRHDATPLRLPPAAIAATLEAQGVSCTHFDAFRFFTPAARPLNRLQPGPDDRDAHEQPGCLHANMDLYKWAYKAYPYLPSDLLLDCFALALQARVLDMRASPYDLRALGYAPIPIETPDGRQQYVQAQRQITATAEPLRTRLIAACDALLAWLETDAT